MEQHTADILSLPIEIYSFIFPSLKAIELYDCQLVCKYWQHALIDSWKIVAKREFDLDPQAEDAVRQAKICAIINRNIRNGRCVQTVLVSSSKQNTRRKFIHHVSFNDNSALLKWVTYKGPGYGQVTEEETVIMDLKRKEITSTVSDVNGLLHFYGPYLVRQEGIHGMPKDCKCAEITSTGLQLNEALPTSNTIGIVHNEAPYAQHLIAILSRDQSTMPKIMLNIQIYDLKKKDVTCTRAVSDYSFDSPNSLKPSVWFYGDQIHCLTLNVGQPVLKSFDINDPSKTKELDMAPLLLNGMPSDPTNWMLYPNLHGCTTSFLFGHTFEYPGQHNVWCYNRMKNTIAFHDLRYYSRIDVRWYYGLLMVLTEGCIQFLDPYSEGDILSVVATIHAENIPLRGSREHGMQRDDGKLLLACVHNSISLHIPEKKYLPLSTYVKMLDFLHVNHDVQLLAITGSTNDQMVTHNIKAYQLTKKLKEIFGTANFLSRYFLSTANERYGIAFTERKDGPKMPINMQQLIAFSPDYNTPYVPCVTSPDITENEWTLVQFSGYTEDMSSLHHAVVLFYERFDGNNWLLSVPSDWNEALQLIINDRKCIVQ